MIQYDALNECCRYFSDHVSSELLCNLSLKNSVLKEFKYRDFCEAYSTDCIANYYIQKTTNMPIFLVFSPFFIQYLTSTTFSLQPISEYTRSSLTVTEAFISQRIIDCFTNAMLQNNLDVTHQKQTLSIDTAHPFCYDVTISYLAYSIFINHVDCGTFGLCYSHAL